MNPTEPALNALTALVDSARRLQGYAAQRDYARTAARADQLAANLDTIRIRLVRLGADDLPNAWEAVDSGRRAIVHIKRVLIVKEGRPWGQATDLHDMAPTPLVAEFRDAEGRRCVRYLGHDHQRGIHAGSELLRDTTRQGR